MTEVAIVETPGGDQPLAKAQGDVVGFTTQLAEATAYASTAQERVDRVRAECEQRIADAEANVARAGTEVVRLQAELDAANAAIPAAQEAQAAYDAAQAAPPQEG